jgi:hypothetical protein
MRHKRNIKKHSIQHPNLAGVSKPKSTGPESTNDHSHDLPVNSKGSHVSGPSCISPPISRASTPSTSTSKTSFVRPSLALTKLHRHQHERRHRHDEEEELEDEGEVEPYSPHDPYFTPSQSIRPHARRSHHHHHHHHHHQLTQDLGIEPADPHVIQLWEQDLRSRLQQAYPRMCYYFLCDKSLFVFVTLLTIRRIDKADALRGRSLPGRREDRQYVDDIAQCMSDAENRFDKDEEWMTWWRETLLTVQQGLQRGWIGADSPVRLRSMLCKRLLTISSKNIAYAKDIMKLYRRFSKIAQRLAEVEAGS